MRLLINMRWLALTGQGATVILVHFALGIALPVIAMLAIIGALFTLNLISLARTERSEEGSDDRGEGISDSGREEIGNSQLFAALLLDVLALTGLLYFSGGATNPFISLYLLQIVLGAVLLRSWSSWIIVGINSICFLLLVQFHIPLNLPEKLHLGPFDLYILGTFASFALIAVLLVLYVTRINANLRAGDAKLAAMRQHAAEEDHIFRMGLLASGAAHELGTPLASLAVIVNDWTHYEKLKGDPVIMEELDDMRIAVDRCKLIVGNILLSAGQARGENPVITTVFAFLEEVVSDWRARHGGDALTFENLLTEDENIVSDSALKQVIGNILDNAREASGTQICLAAMLDNGNLIIRVQDNGPGFDPDVLANFGKPYVSTKGKLGGGLGLFLVVNAMRKMGGNVSVANEPSGGAVVTLSLPLIAILYRGTTA
ncbi:HAMP domain-containing histidine kinase [Parasphingorhabdus halotolerans]|uniref:histidine kinase n=2 Tax=Parasphingorhabdus halotolerans TaxID=2725558 RepID=A0A6H2DSY7_9SPHN|nr:HAMP domain-containing histidine kinase [Parasphingorhabdus halotolerans]